MDDLSTKQRPRNVFAAILRSHRIRGLLLLVISLFGMYFFFLSTALPSNKVPYMDDVNVNELQQGDVSTIFSQQDTGTIEHWIAFKPMSRDKLKVDWRT